MDNRPYHTNFNTVGTGEPQAPTMVPLTDWLKKIRGRLSRSERITEQLPDGCVVIPGKVPSGGVFRKQDCDCDPPVKHGPHWVRDTSLSEQYGY